MTQPQRIQRKRTAGWTAPEGAVYVGRGSKWGNPFRAVANRGQRSDHGPWFVVDNNGVDYPSEYGDDELGATICAVHLYARDIVWGSAKFTADEVRAELAGKTLMCWCDLDAPCHADVLLDLANGGDAE